MEGLQDTYKDTKIGRIPKDWEVIKLSEVVDLLNNKRKPINSSQRNSISGDIPYYGANGQVDRINDFIFNEPLILMAEDGGNFSDYEFRHIAYKISGKSWVNNHAHVLKPKSDFDFDYVFYELEHKNILRFINGSTRTKLNQGDLKGIPLKIPPLPEQQKIAAILSTVDEQISTTDKIIKKSKELKKGLMQKLFSEGIGHTEFKDTKIGLNLEILNGFPAKSTYFNNERKGLPLIRIRNIIKGHSETYYSGEFNSKYLIKKGDILIGMDGDFNIVKWTGVPSILNQRICKLIAAKDPFNLEYLYYYLEVELKKIQARTPSTTVKHLSIKDLRKVNAYCPPIPEQQKIAAILSEADAKIEKEQSQKAQLEALKKGLMQQLLTGKKRVTV